ncbi:MAG: hypothetical protein A2145_01220 [candidate division Zixibacteria bacterium RBG_16_40_9]|nr:MAG: hypothetical protein A2145_01220 [candidate division Zixibacteria bacterium RBG_16_40_9]
MKKLLVKDLKPGTEVLELFALRKKELKEYDGKIFLKLELGDKSGRIDAVIWDKATEYDQQIETGDIVKVKGFTSSYKNNLQIKIDDILSVPTEKVDLEDFLPVAEKSPDELLQEYKKIAFSLKNPLLRAVMEKILADEKIVEKLKIAPGGKLWHHCYIGGLLEHTLKIVEICQKTSQMYELVDRDLLLAGALLHDIGKITSYHISTFIDFTDEGRLLGHIVEGDRMVSEKIREIPNFPEELALKLRHLILSHQGELEMGSPVVPQTLEAIILHFADEMDAQAGAFSYIIKRDKEANKKWSDWVPLIKRYIYIGEEEK